MQIGIEAITVNYCFVQDKGGLSNACAQVARKELGNRDKKLKHQLSETLIILNYEENTSAYYWGLLSFVELQFVL